MSLENTPKFGRTLALRLTIWYAAIFAASSMLALLLIYVLIVSLVAERADDDLRQDIDEFATLFQQGGLDRVRSEMLLDTHGEEAEKVFFRLWSDAGHPIAATELSAWVGLSRPPEKALEYFTRGANPELDGLALPLREDRARRIMGAIAPGIVLEIGQSLEEYDEFVAQVLRKFFLALAIILLFGGPIGWFMARRALRGVKEITRTANEITKGALDRRVPVGTKSDELDNLASTFNTMLDRIQGLIIGMRDMADNLAHDLRSPLTRIRASAEMCLTNDDADGGTHGLAVHTIEECDRLLAMLNTTLDIAEAEAGAAKLNLSRVDLTETVLAACELFQTVAEDNRIRIVTSISKSCFIQADRQRLQRVIANLLDNALKYSPPGGEVRIGLYEQAGQVALTIEDTGIGISPNDLPRIFQRFYRCDTSRSQQGIGLGLNLALAFVRAQGGDIKVTSTQNVGSAFTIILPRSPDEFSVLPMSTLDLVVRPT